MVRIPDSPAVSFFQLSDLPDPSEVTTPMPVTTTIGLPNLSRVAAMFSPRQRPLLRMSEPNEYLQIHGFTLVLESTIANSERPNAETTN
jgi:hypothetical protein